MKDDTRFNAPPTRILDLPMEQRRQAMVRRDEARRHQFMARYAPKPAKPTLRDRITGLIGRRAA